MKNQQGFTTWSEQDRKKMWDKSLTVEQFLLSNVREYTDSMVKFQLGSLPELASNEKLLFFCYGGCLSTRAGWLIVSRETNKILQSVTTIIS